jgi:site-specific DNA-methyltransferase (adenine-specific)
MRRKNPTTETPDFVHGRLVESVHLSGYTMERACGELEWLLEADRWKQCGPGYTSIDDFLATLDLSEFKLAIGQRKQLAQRLDTLRASQRATARLLGVGVATINRDLVPDGTRKDKNNGQVSPSDVATVPDGTPAWFQSDADPSRTAKQQVLKQEAVAMKEARKRIPGGPLETDAYQILHGNCADIALARPVDWIITDPPYGADAIPFYSLLGQWAVTNLKTGGSCLVMTGQLCLPEVLAVLTISLRYHWTLAWLMPGGMPTQIWPRKVSCFWKPVIWLTNGPSVAEHMLTDVLHNKPNDRDKADHHWGQADAGFAQLIDVFTQPGDTICDPFCGGGTTGLAAVALRRKFIGIDADAAAIEMTRKRLAELREEMTCSEKSSLTS